MLSASQLAAATFAQYLSAFPLALNAKRENPNTGVAAHCVPEELIKALCSGFLTAVQPAKVFGLLKATPDPVGNAATLPFMLPAASAAEGLFVVGNGMLGADGVLFAAVVIGDLVETWRATTFLQMDPCAAAGTGSATVAPVTNPSLQASLEAALNASLPAALQASGFFGQDDVPGASVNALLLSQLPKYAAAYAGAVASVTAEVPFVGVGGVPGAVTSPVTGAFL